jgi:glycosyltransferase involved in cell wall biosynthesis
VEEMVEAAKKVDSLDPRACRKWVEDHFSAEVMIKAYEEVYEDIMNREKK